MSKADLRIVLVETSGALNLGSVARVMKNFGFTNLVLVNPQCDPHSSDARMMAVHAKDLLENATIVNSLSEGLDGCQHAVATTARFCEAPLPHNTPKTALPWLFESNAPKALIFGPEERGLSNAELQHAQCWMSIPADPGYNTLNLAQSVALCCYDMFQLVEQPPPVPTEKKGELSASLKGIESYLGHMEEVLLDIGYLWPHTATKRMEKFRSLLHRSHPTEQELALLRGVWAQVEWALKDRAAQEESTKDSTED